MPKGVDHRFLDQSPRRWQGVQKSLMPKGVDHFSTFLVDSSEVVCKNL